MNVNSIWGAALSIGLALESAGLRSHPSATSNEGCKSGAFSGMPGNFLRVSRPLSVTLVSLSAELDIFLFAPQHLVHPSITAAALFNYDHSWSVAPVERTRRSDSLGFLFQALSLTTCDPGEVPFPLWVSSPQCCKVSNIGRKMHINCLLSLWARVNCAIKIRSLPQEDGKLY